ncbi:TetR/AcrR family transcriptional regulator [Actinophytocola sp.]|uniref:TetR/AcrR family transcriptional regulator n=1 Tax=Actinophytocola sp. TaxID=1872138 RepID=UPI002D7FD2FD|nr:TetR family transcriptional regulator [Actinophytocola sp.]HET9144419.1 TetR family transcriptional regulator [Actinophytocola sp.]
MSQVKSRREQYSAATRAALLDAATRRFAERGFTGTALEDVAADIQATRGAVYHHFANKTALFEAVFEELESAAVAECAAAARAAGDDPWQAAIAALAAFLDICCDPVYGRVVWQEAPLALGWHRWRECEEKFAYGLIEQLLSAMMTGGVIDDLPLETTTRITFALLMAAGLALSDAPEEDKEAVKAEYSLVISRLITGLSTPTP